MIPICGLLLPTASRKRIEVSASLPPPFRGEAGSTSSSPGTGQIGPRKQEAPEAEIPTRRVTPVVGAGASPRTLAHAWVTVAISTNPDALRELDAAVVRLKQAGIRRMSRSWLLRIALERLDLDELEADLLEVTR